MVIHACTFIYLFIYLFIWFYGHFDTSINSNIVQYRLQAIWLQAIWLQAICFTLLIKYINCLSNINKVFKLFTCSKMDSTNVFNSTNSILCCYNISNVNVIVLLLCLVFFSCHFCAQRNLETTATQGFFSPIDDFEVSTITTFATHFELSFFFLFCFFFLLWGSFCLFHFCSTSID